MGDTTEKIELDISDLLSKSKKADEAFARLDNALKRLENTSAKTGRGLTKAGDAMGEIGLRSDKKVAHNVAHLTSTLMTSGSVADAASAGFFALGNSMKLGLGPMIGLAAVAVAVQKVSEGYKEVEESITGANKALRHNSSAAMGESGLMSQIGEVNAAQEKTEKSNSALMIADRFGGFLIGKNTNLNEATPGGREEKQQQANNALIKRREVLNAALASIGKSEIGTRSESESGSLQTAEHGAVKDKLAKRMAELQGKSMSGEIGADAYRSLTLSAKDAAAVEGRTIDKKWEATNRNLALETELNGIKSKGADVELNSAKAVLVAKETALAQAEYGTEEERQAAQVAVDAAQFSVEAAQKTSDEQERQLGLARELLAIDESSADGKLDALEKIRAAAQKNFDLETRADQKKLLGAKRNQAEKASALENHAQNKAVAQDRMAIDAEGDQLQLIKEGQKEMADTAKLRYEWEQKIAAEMLKGGKHASNAAAMMTNAVTAANNLAISQGAGGTQTELKDAEKKQQVAEKILADKQKRFDRTGGMVIDKVGAVDPLTGQPAILEGHIGKKHYKGHWDAAQRDKNGTLTKGPRWVPPAEEAKRDRGADADDIKKKVDSIVTALGPLKNMENILSGVAKKIEVAA